MNMRLPIPKKIFNSMIDPFNLNVYVNGVLQVQGTSGDYIIQSGAIEFFNKINFGYIVQIILLEDGIQKVIYKYVGKNLWSCISESSSRKRPILDQTTFNFDEEPENNNGRDICYWCNSPTKEIKGFSQNYNVCVNCGK